MNHTPIPAGNRILSLDVLRGVALFGILLINVNMLHSPVMYKQLLGLDLWTTTWEQTTYVVVNFFVQGKFYALFSFLFGYGFYIFMTRAEQRMERSSKRLYVRRLSFLFGLGLVHIIFFWWGDILTWYALVGMLLLAFFKQSPKVLLSWAFGVIALYMTLNLLLLGSIMQMPATSSTDIGADSYYADMLASSYKLYTGSYLDAMAQRLVDMMFYLPQVTLAAIFTVLPMFLFGLYTANKGWLADVKKHIRKIRAIWFVTLILGFGLTFLKEWGLSGVDASVVTMHDVYHLLGMLIGDPALCFFYISSVVLLINDVPKLRLWNWLASAGRMALTNYLLQTMICTTLFYGYGFGLYGKVGAIEAYLIAIVIFITQLCLSHWWMRRFAYGPLEKIWRMWTYGRKG